MADGGDRWAIVLAAGDGTRLSSLTRVGGVAVPKQFCSLSGGPSLLRLAIRRAAAVVGRGRVVVIVSAMHGRWWRRELDGVPAANVLVQPANRGTAAGVLLPLLAIRDRDPRASVLVVPSDHFVEREAPLARSARTALSCAESHDTIVLLGLTPDSPEPGYGWIVPGERRGPGLTSVASFVEKPPAAEAHRLFADGALWNTFLFAGRIDTLLTRFLGTLPDLHHALEDASLLPLRAGAEATSVNGPSAYATVPHHDFSREVLQPSAAGLEVVRVPGCGWSDLGTPDRVAAALRRLGRASRRIRGGNALAAALDLGAAHSQMEAAY